ncbi:MAG: DUF6259 domain-containing protein [Chloroflexota bacterium]|nr:DUF6259 domain-containing protein [Chloroflexota bacterium]MDE2909096.1 DUF6259 domain-containing protein [Chloroflexota bacterium]
MNIITLENNTLRLEFARETGALVGFTVKHSAWEVLNRHHLGLSFQLLIPLPGRRNNPVYGEKQKAASVEVADDGRSVAFTWDSVASAYGGEHQIKLVMKVTMSSKQAVFSLSIDNQSEYVVEIVHCPYFGDVQPPPAAEHFEAFHYGYAEAVRRSLYPTFENTLGYYGFDYPVQYGPDSWRSGAPAVPYVLLRSAEQGLYVGVCEPSAELVAWHNELRPGYDSAIDSRVPASSSISGLDVATRFAAIHLPYIQPGESRSLTPIAVEPFLGGWQHGVDVYRRWRNSWMTTPEIPEWARQPHAWWQLHINSPEDELRIPFKELGKIGEEAARHGVSAIQLVGWNDGGQDQGNPSHSPDPRLGTFDELKAAIAEIQSYGVKLIIFAKFTWADRATEWFRDELHRMAVKDPYGDYYLYNGYQYHTATQALNINTKRLIPMCFGSDAYFEVCAGEFQKVLDLGADGILYDENQHHSPTLLCFDESHGHRLGFPVYSRDNEFQQRLERMSQPANPDFLFAGEGIYDWQFEVYHLSYHRSWDKRHLPLSRYMLPHMPLMTAISGFNDRNMVNQCLLYRYIMSFEPYNFKGRLDDFPLTMDYAKRMDALRSELRDYFWDGEFRHEVGATVTNGCGEAHHPYAVFLSKSAGAPGIAVANYEDEATKLTVELESAHALSRYRLVDSDQWTPVSGGIAIPARSAAVVI